MRRPNADREEKRVTRGRYDPEKNRSSLTSKTPIREVSQPAGIFE
jgi:hypothetical protein